MLTATLCALWPPSDACSEADSHRRDCLRASASQSQLTWDRKVGAHRRLLANTEPEKIGAGPHAHPQQAGRAHRADDLRLRLPALCDEGRKEGAERGGAAGGDLLADGVHQGAVKKHITKKSTFEDFFAAATVHPNASSIRGVICGYRVEEIESPLTRNVRYLDKLVDELARGRKMEKILRE